MMHTLLNHNTEDDILFIQEPWFGNIGTARDDALREGREVFGGVGNPKWNAFYPHFTNGLRAKVMTYARIHDIDKPFKRHLLRGSARLDLCAHPCILITDFSFNNTVWRMINFYNDVDDPSALSTLISLDLDPTIHTIVVGDFNSHSRSWSPAGWDNYSTSAARIEGWASCQGLQLLSWPGIPTHRGENGARDSTIDLVWGNQISDTDGTFVVREVNWEDSFASDHALIRIRATSSQKARRLPMDRATGFQTTDSPKVWEAWTNSLKESLPNIIPPLLSTFDIDEHVDLVYFAIHRASKIHLKKRGAVPGFNSKWWNEECRSLAKLVREEKNPDEKVVLARELKKVIARTKRVWADSYIRESCVWEVAAWRHGRKASHIPALRDEEGNNHYDHSTMSNMLSERFFAQLGSHIPTHFADDPTARTRRSFHLFEEDELWRQLVATSNTSAPGSSGIGWLIIKKAWEHIKEHLCAIYNACLLLGHHPRVWKEAKVVVIPKPDKPDYSLPKAHRPISLLETMSKLLEKVIAKRIQFDLVQHELVPTNQFGGRMHSSCLDAAMTLVHDIQAAHAAGLKTGMVLFDVKGFFDNINHDRMEAVLVNLGFDSLTTGWVREFLRDRKVRLSFNNITSEERTQPVGVPQGSPLSPVLSIIYTSGLLHLMRDWNNSSLGMYVDDGALFACADEWADVDKLLRARYTVCEDWLRRAGLAIEPDKMELIYFQKPGVAHPLPAPTQLFLPYPTLNTYYSVKPVEVIRYLGFFIQRRLKWDAHVTIMCNRAMASAKAMQLLGNTIRGLDMANWRIVLNAVCLPVLSYGLQLWFTPGGSNKLINKLQVVQNKMVRMVAGAFRTAPCEALCHITRMLPMKQYAEKLTYTSALRLYRLPRASQLLRRLGPNWHAPGHGDLPMPVPQNLPKRGRGKQCPTVLEALALRVPSHGPKVDLTVIAPWEVPNWAAQTSHWGVIRPAERKEWVQSLYEIGLNSSTEVVFTSAKVTERDVGDLTVVGGAALVSCRGGEEPKSLKRTVGSEVTQFDAGVCALAMAGESLAERYGEGTAPPQVIYIFGADNSALQAIRNPRSLKAHSFCVRFHKALTTFFLIHRDVRLILAWSPKNDDLFPDRLARELAAEAANEFPPSGMNSIQSAAYQKDRARRRAFSQWEEEYHLNRMMEAAKTNWLGVDICPPRFAYSHAIISAPSVTHHPLWKEATTRVPATPGSKKKVFKYRRRTTATALQLAVDHAFTGSYAKRFRPKDPPESLTCKCGAKLRDPNHILRRCPIFHTQRVNAAIHASFRTLSLRQMFNEFPDRLLAFLQAPGIARPQTGPQLWVEEETEQGIG